MGAHKPERPFPEGWFAQDAEGAHLIGSRCADCGTFYFPRQSRFCRNQACEGERFEDTPLSRRGRLWSYTDACYQPPEPFVASDLQLAEGAPRLHILTGPNMGGKENTAANASRMAGEATMVHRDQGHREAHLDHRGDPRRREPRARGVLRLDGT